MIPIIKTKFDAFKNLPIQIRLASAASTILNFCGIMILLGNYFDSSLTLLELGFLTFLFDSQCRYLIIKLLIFIKKEYPKLFPYMFTASSVIMFSFFFMECDFLIRTPFLTPKEFAVIPISIYICYAIANLLFNVLATTVILETLVPTPPPVKHNTIKQTIKIEYYENAINYN